ncbi:MAG: hydroxymethylbilane synthase [Nitrospiraceae bacterium]|nr:hydroxymethylbilane synthase [Nitrospiraceae bacterium]
MTGAIRIGTRGSQLALWQAHWVADQLRALRPGLVVDVQIVKTTGDTVQDRPLALIGVKGAFTKELDRALLGGEVDVVVHSLKDVPTEPAPGIALVAVPEREDARDVFVGKNVQRVADLPQGAQVGTGSLRRRAQLQATRPDLEITDLRGNIDTRLRKLVESKTLEGIILAAAGVVRLGLLERVTEHLAYADWLPAPGQGALGITVRDTDSETGAVAALLDDPAARAAVTAERAFLARLEGGCHVPVGAYAQLDAGTLVLDGLVADPDGSRTVRATSRGAPAEAEALGTALADTLLSMGGGAILAALEEGSTE